MIEIAPNFSVSEGVEIKIGPRLVSVTSNGSATTDGSTFIRGSDLQWSYQGSLPMPNSGCLVVSEGLVELLCQTKDTDSLVGENLWKVGKSCCARSSVQFVCSEWMNHAIFAGLGTTDSGRSGSLIWTDCQYVGRLIALSS